MFDDLNYVSGTRVLIQEVVIFGSRACHVELIMVIGSIIKSIIIV